MVAEEDWVIWAPFAERVARQVDETRTELTPLAEKGSGQDAGLFRAAAPDHGADYRLALDDAEPIPDPRSREQPNGVHGPSRWWDFDRLRRSLGVPPRSSFRPVPLTQAVLYELHVGSFSAEGTLQGAIPHLDHLVSLGITHVELMPVGEFMGEFGWGYDVVFPFSVHAAYGGPSGLFRFVQACHERGLAVILDVVFNHLGPHGNYLGKFGPYFTDRYRTSWGDALNFDGPGSDQVRRYFLDNVRQWFEEYHIDGLRLDAVQAIFDGRACHFLEELSAYVDELSDRLERPLVLIAESHQNDPGLALPRERGGRAMDAMWSDDLHHAVHALLTGEQGGYYADHGPLGNVAQALADGFVLDGRYSRYYQRGHGRPAGDLPSECFVVYLQNHDQIGNRARGDRLGHGISAARLRVGQALILLGPFVPMLFQGEEWNASAPFPFFADPPDEGLARAIRRGRLREYAHWGWEKRRIPDPTARATFDSCRLDWSELEKGEHQRALEWVAQLLQLRAESGGCFPRHELAVWHDEGSGLLSFRRGPWAVWLNCTDETRDCALQETNVEDLGLRLASEASVALNDHELHLPAWSVGVLGPISC